MFEVMDVRHRARSLSAWCLTGSGVRVKGAGKVTQAVGESATQVGQRRKKGEK